MSCSNEFRVEVKADEGCWKPASVFGYLEHEGKGVLSVYLLDSPSVEVCVPLEHIRWPRDSKVAKNFVLNDAVEVEYCEKHDNFMKNGIYKWLVGEIIEFHEEKCIIKTAVGQLNIATNRLFTHTPSLNFRDEDFTIFSSCIDIVGELKNVSFSSEYLKLICQEVAALTVNYKENEDKLIVLSINPQTIELCNTYQQTNSKVVPSENIISSVAITDTPIEQNPLTESLKIDSNVMGLAVGFNKLNYQSACKIDGITSIQILNNSFIIKSTSPKAMKEAIDKLDMISVVENFPLCNEHKIEGIKNSKIVKEIFVIERDFSSKNMKVKLVGRRTDVENANKVLRDIKMAERIGHKSQPKAKHVSYEVQPDGSRLLYATADCKPKPRRMNSDVPYKRINSLISSESDSSPRSPPEAFPSFPKTDKPYGNHSPTQKGSPLFQQPENTSTVPLGAKPVTPEFTKTNSPKCTQSQTRGLAKGDIYRQHSDHSIGSSKKGEYLYTGDGYGHFNEDKGNDPYEFWGKGQEWKDKRPVPRKDKYHQSRKKAHSQTNILKEKYSSTAPEDLNCLDDVFTKIDNPVNND